VTPVDDGGRLLAGGFGLLVIHSPGHTAGHACDELATEDGRHAFIDDTFLPVYTPNVGGSDCRLDNPLPEYLASLRHLADREYDRLWPGHRSVIHEPCWLIREIVDYHRALCQLIISVLDDHGPADAGNGE